MKPRNTLSRLADDINLEANGFLSPRDLVSLARTHVPGLGFLAKESFSEQALKLTPMELYRLAQNDSDIRKVVLRTPEFCQRIASLDVGLNSLINDLYRLETPPAQRMRRRECF